jgi:outer membrane biosynthesis protein TonB
MMSRGDLSIRVAFVAAALALIAGCTSMPDFDPTDLLNFENIFNAKKPLPGQRKDLFPEGVPGVSRGVPSELVKGNQAAAQEPEPQVIQVEEPKPKPKAKPKPKPKVATAPESRPTAVTVRPQPSPQPAPQSGQQWPDPPAPTGRSGAGGVQWPDPPAPR